MRKAISFIAFLCIFKLANAQLSFPDLVKQTEKSVVTILTLDASGNPLMRGTGFLINDKGVILSNYHIFDQARRAKITMFDGTEFDLDSIILCSKEYDIIKFTVSNTSKIQFKSLRFSGTKPVKGEDIFTIGNPLGLESTVSKGIISSIRVIPEVGNIYQITAPISNGSSGSPVLNMNGEVFGIATFQMTGGQNLNFAIDVSLVEKIKSNDAIFSDLNVKKKLPKDKDNALLAIDSLFKPQDQLSYLNEFIKEHPNDYRGYLKRANLYCGSYSAYELLDSIYKSKGDSLFFIGMSRVFAKSIPDYNHAVLLNQSEPLIYYYRGLYKYNYCKENPNKIIGWTFQSAIEDLVKCKNISSKAFRQESYNYLGLCYLELTKYKEAQTAFDGAIDIKDLPSDSTRNLFEIYYERGKLKYDQLKDTVGALRDINKALELFKNSYLYQGEDNAPSRILAKRAAIRLNSNDLQGALEDIRKVNKSSYLGDDARCAYTHYLQCNLLRTLDGDLSEALESINIAIKWAGSVGSNFFERSKVYFALKDFSNALFDINKCYDLSPNDFDSESYYYRSKIKSMLKDNVGAIKDVDIAIKMNVKNDRYYFLKGIYLSELGDEFGAIKQYNKAIEINSNDPDYFINRGWSKLKSNQTEACADWSKAGEMGKYDAYDLIKKYCK